MMPVLAIDTAGPVLGVALFDGARLATRVQRIARGAEEVLPQLVAAVCEELGHRLQAVGGVAIAVGPGAFTGLRVGLAAAGGYASALGVPLWPANSLLPRAHAAGLDQGPLVVMLDAKKSRVYGAIYLGEVDAQPEDVAPDVLLDRFTVGASHPAQVQGTRIAGVFRATGEGALVYQAAVEIRGGTVVANADQPGVECLARLGHAGLSRGEGISAAALTADYAREPDAVVRGGRT